MGFKEFFSKERQDARLAEAKAKHAEARGGCFRYLVGAILIAILLLVVVVIL